MDITSLVIFIAIGAVAGFFAGHIMKGNDFGLIPNIVVGVIGSVVGSFVFSLLGITAGGIIGQIIVATVGAALLIVIIRYLRRI